MGDLLLLLLLTRSIEVLCAEEEVKGSLVTRRI